MIIDDQPPSVGDVTYDPLVSILHYTTIGNGSNRSDVFGTISGRNGGPCNKIRHKYEDCNSFQYTDPNAHIFQNGNTYGNTYTFRCYNEDIYPNRILNTNYDRIPNLYAICNWNPKSLSHSLFYKYSHNFKNAYQYSNHQSYDHRVTYFYTNGYS